MTWSAESSRVCVLHTVASLPAVFGPLIAREAPRTAAYHVVDESLLGDTVVHGLLPQTVRRLAAYATLAQDAGARAVLVTCPSMGRAVELARPLAGIPLLRIDEPMAREAVAGGHHVGVLGTLHAALDPTADLIRQVAAETGAAVDVTTSVCPGAHEAWVAGDHAGHDRLIAQEAVRMTHEVDVLVLAQAPMAEAVATVPTGGITVPVLTSPLSGVRQLAALG
ncbi:aspartate/glutamate racemase family protein [Streptomyces sp. SL13]|uniref:Aspartate/glutamate racemase family protein n=1 Tax=Streptantibioticus silvisoli TaxID=2705255 RepID=A0AA90H0L2_9ACTN|nr:aspartate/glutamate racemase family protein [Streptantibioticus silvisoli]MDI5962549.1 aspartate/glutamate racemase family protein [Streptantibioticus silvisoli]MDI5969181.1 aspartate/glutamate racemase family protein [Streptantibioticus silvisoli]